METKGIITIEYETIGNIVKRIIKVNGKPIYENESDSIFSHTNDENIIAVIRRILIEINPNGYFNK